MNTKKIFFGMVIVVISLSAVVFAFQDPYPMTGYVIDNLGAPVGLGANVTFTNQNTSEVIYDDTSSYGWYTNDAANFPSGYTDGDTISYYTVFGAYTNTTSHVINVVAGYHRVNITVELSSGGCVAPIISSLTNGVPATNSVAITWSTDISSDNRIKYSKNSDLSGSSWSTWQNSTSSINIGLTSLDSATPYYYQAWSYNSTNNSCYDTERTSQPHKTFTTASDPVYTVSGYVTDSHGAIETAYIVNNITVDTDYTNSIGYYSLSLSNGTYQITASKASYNSNSIDVTVDGSTVSNADITLSQPPCTTPVISDVTNSDPTYSSTIVTWTINQSADNRVKYSKNDDLSKELWSGWHNDTSSVSINIDGLDENTTYYYQATSYNGTNSSCVITSPPSSPFKSFITAVYGSFEERMNDRLSDSVSSSYALMGALLLVIVASLIIGLLYGLQNGQIDTEDTVAGVIVLIVVTVMLAVAIYIFAGIGIT